VYFWLFVIVVLVGGWNMDAGVTSRHSAALSARPAGNPVTTLPPVTWTAASTDTALSAAPTTSDRRQKVQFTTAGNQPAHAEILYGSTHGPSDIALTTRNAPAGTPNIQYPEGPGLRVTRGWAFITFRWPLIWTEGIDAGSIGTTAVLNSLTDRADVYLIANGLDTTSQTPPTRPPGVTDPDVHLYIRADGAPAGVGVKIPTGYQAVRRSYKVERDAQGKVTKVTLAGQKSLRVVKDASGKITVADDKFLQGVLEGATQQGLYTLP
jgi:hypothetical protein